MRNIKTLPDIIKFCATIGNLPTSYMLSLTYEEQLLWLLKFLNETILPTMHETIDSVEELENWFNNLDVQNEVNNKLEEMSESGELQEIISEYLNSKAIFGFDSVADMKEATNLINGSYAKTLGYYETNDGGGSLYKIRQRTYEDVVDEKSIILINEDTVAELILQNNTLNIKQFGAKVDNETDDTDSIQKALDYISSIGGTLFIPSGTALISAPLEISSNTTLMGNKGTSIIKSITDYEEHTFKVLLKNKHSVMDLSETHDENIIIKNIVLNNNGEANAGHDGLIQFRGVYNANINNVDLKVNGSNCWGLILFSANKDILVNKVNVINNSEDNSLGGCIWVRSGLNHNNNDNIKSTGMVIENCYLESTAKDELLCIADGVAGGWTEAIVNNCTIVGKAVTNYSSNGIVVNAVGSNDSYLKTNISNINIKGNFSNAGILHGYNTTSKDTTESVYNNINIKLDNSTYGIRSYYKEQIFNNCYIDVGNSAKSCSNCTITNSDVKSTITASYVYNCNINAVGVGADDCLIVKDSKIKATINGIHTYGGVTNFEFTNNIIEADSNGIFLQPSNQNVGASKGIISGNILKRINNTSNAGSAGIKYERGIYMLITNNFTYGSIDNASQEKDVFQYLTISNNSSNITKTNNFDYQI